ncbi:MAG: DUF58 domain-containing protein [Arcanobacterium sp.]|nr:DUF58 domain-containing protein [Arcanobacterium sp.]MDY5589305.1 DUF58 domain-containing protein [Arcanobacterium sp.]
MYIRFSVVPLSLAGVLLALLTSSHVVLILFEVALALLCVLDAALAPAPRHLSVHREAAASTRVRTTLEQVLTLTNTGTRRMRGEWRDAWPPSANVVPSRHSFDLAPGASTTHTSTLTPQRRGTRKSEHLTVRSRGPLGFAGRQRSRSTFWNVHVLPAFTSRRHLPARVARLRELEGRALLLTRGQGTEFDSLREYVAGDDVRAIDWRSTARLGTTVVRTWRPERDRQVIIVADSGRGGALRIAENPAFDAYIETSLLMAALAERAGDRVHVFVLDSHVQTAVAAARGIGIINRLGEAFADTEPTLAATDWRLAASEIDRLTHQRSLVVLLTTIGLSAISDGLLDVLPQLARRHTVLIGSVQRSKSDLVNFSAAEDAFQAAASARSELEVAAVIRNLQQLGATVVQERADGLPPAIADTYIELKARGKL